MEGVDGGPVSFSGAEVAKGVEGDGASDRTFQQRQDHGDGGAGFFVPISSTVRSNTLPQVFERVGGISEQRN